MSTELVIHIALMIVMGLASTIFWFWAHGQSERFAEINRRFDEANKLLSGLASRMQEEHLERRRLIEALNVALGTMRTDVAKQEERGRANEARINELWQRQFPMGRT